MTTPAIILEHLSKRYKLGRNRPHLSLREAFAESLRGVRGLFQAGKAAPSPSDNSFWALEELSLTVNAGDTLGLIGHNGSGKSTLLKILSQITEPTHGVARIHGRVGSLLEVGTGFHPDLTGRENIFLNGSILGMRQREIARKLDEIVAFAEVDRFLDTAVKHYSSGMYLRLAFAVAAHLETDVLLVDEVLAVGDAAFQKKCLGKMEDAAHSGRTVLFVSHDLNAVKKLCRSALHMKQGRMVQIGPTDEVIDGYLKEAQRGVSHSGAQVQARLDWLNVQSGQKSAWGVGETLRLMLTVQPRMAMARPVIELSLNSEGGVRLFAINTEEQLPACAAGADLALEFEVMNSGLNVSHVTITVEVSDSKRTPAKIGHFEQLQKITVTPRQALSTMNVPHLIDLPAKLRISPPT